LVKKVGERIAGRGPLGRSRLHRSRCRSGFLGGSSRSLPPSRRGGRGRRSSPPSGRDANGFLALRAFDRFARQMVGSVQNLTAFARYSNWHSGLTGKSGSQKTKSKAAATFASTGWHHFAPPSPRKQWPTPPFRSNRHLDRTRPSRNPHREQAIVARKLLRSNPKL
jgi:hypothetical protein